MGKKRSGGKKRNIIVLIELHKKERRENIGKELRYACLHANTVLDVKIHEDRANRVNQADALADDALWPCVEALYNG